MVRLPVVADQFYTGNATDLIRDLGRLIPESAGAVKQRALAVVSPHAGYLYSGSVAGETFGRVEVPEDVVVLGPNHHGQGRPVALAKSGVWRMPMGDIPLNDELAEGLLMESERVVEDEVAHRFEHSLEVQLPFLQFFQKNLRLTPLVLSHLSYGACREIGLALARALMKYQKPVLIVASTDMTHYESRQAAAAKDEQALAKIMALDPQGLYETVVSQGISMCGIMPTTVALVAALEIGAQRAELVRYADSGEVSGDTRQVVGYAGMVIS